MKISDFVDYEMNEDGCFWIPEHNHNPSPYYLNRDYFFISENHINISKTIDLIGMKLFETKWTGNEKTSTEPFLCFQGPDSKSHYIDLVEFGTAQKRRRRQGPEETIINEVLVKPWSTAYYERNAAAHERMNTVLKALREKLYSGEITTEENPVRPKKIPPTHWAGELWDICIYNRFPEQDGGLMYEYRPHIFFLKSEVMGLLDKIGGDSHSEPLQLAEIALSPYIKFAARIADELKITQDYTPKKTTVAEHISENWPADCGDKSKHKINMIASLVRWPSHETGGNTKSKSPKG